MSGLQAAREKNACARSCDHLRASPAPVSIPVTVPVRGLVTSPDTKAAKVPKLGAVNTYRRLSNTAASDAGMVGSGSIGGLLCRGGNITADASLTFQAISPQLLQTARSGAIHHACEDGVNWMI